MSDTGKEEREWRFYLDDTIWSIIQDDIPALIAVLEKFKDESA